MLDNIYITLILVSLHDPHGHMRPLARRWAISVQLIVIRNACHQVRLRLTQVGMEVKIKTILYHGVLSMNWVSEKKLLCSLVV